MLSRLKCVIYCSILFLVSAVDENNGSVRVLHVARESMADVEGTEDPSSIYRSLYDSFSANINQINRESGFPYDDPNSNRGSSTPVSHQRSLLSTSEDASSNLPVPTIQTSLAQETPGYGDVVSPDSGFVEIAQREYVGTTMPLSHDVETGMFSISGSTDVSTSTPSFVPARGVQEAAAAGTTMLVVGGCGIGVVLSIITYWVVKKWRTMTRRKSREDEFDDPMAMKSPNTKNSASVPAALLQPFEDSSAASLERKQAYAPTAEVAEEGGQIVDQGTKGCDNEASDASAPVNDESTAVKSGRRRLHRYVQRTPNTTPGGVSAGARSPRTRLSYSGPTHSPAGKLLAASLTTPEDLEEDITRKLYYRPRASSAHLAHVHSHAHTPQRGRSFGRSRLQDRDRSDRVERAPGGRRYKKKKALSMSAMNGMGGSGFMNTSVKLTMGEGDVAGDGDSGVEGDTELKPHRRRARRAGRGTDTCNVDDRDGKESDNGNSEYSGDTDTDASEGSQDVSHVLSSPPIQTGDALHSGSVVSPAVPANYHDSPVISTLDTTSLNHDETSKSRGEPGLEASSEGQTLVASAAPTHLNQSVADTSEDPLEDDGGLILSKSTSNANAMLDGQAIPVSPMTASDPRETRDVKDTKDRDSYGKRHVSSTSDANPSALIVSSTECSVLDGNGNVTGAPVETSQSKMEAVAVGDAEALSQDNTVSGVVVPPGTLDEHALAVPEETTSYEKPAQDVPVPSKSPQKSTQSTPSQADKSSTLTPKSTSESHFSTIPKPTRSTNAASKSLSSLGGPVGTSKSRTVPAAKGKTKSAVSVGRSQSISDVGRVAAKSKSQTQAKSQLQLTKKQAAATVIASNNSKARRPLPSPSSSPKPTRSVSSTHVPSIPSPSKQPKSSAGAAASATPSTTSGSKSSTRALGVTQEPGMVAPGREKAGGVGGAAGKASSSSSTRQDDATPASTPGLDRTNDRQGSGVVASGSSDTPGAVAVPAKALGGAKPAQDRPGVKATSSNSNKTRLPLPAHARSAKPSTSSTSSEKRNAAQEGRASSSSLADKVSPPVALNSPSPSGELAATPGSSGPLTSPGGTSASSKASLRPGTATKSSQPATVSAKSKGSVTAQTRAPPLSQVQSSKSTSEATRRAAERTVAATSSTSSSNVNNPMPRASEGPAKVGNATPSAKPGASSSTSAKPSATSLKADNMREAVRMTLRKSNGDAVDKKPDKAKKMSKDVSSSSDSDMPALSAKPGPPTVMIMRSTGKHVPLDKVGRRYMAPIASPPIPRPSIVPPLSSLVHDRSKELGMNTRAKTALDYLRVQIPKPTVPGDYETFPKEDDPLDLLL
eukprot:Rmarinus@m.12574